MVLIDTVLVAAAVVVAVSPLPADGTEVAEPTAAPQTTPETKTPAPEEKESIDDIHKRARKPPSEGPCKGCGQNKPLNRLMLCYPCWVKKQNTDKGWKEGQPHPAGCGCDLDCALDKNAGGFGN